MGATDKGVITMTWKAHTQSVVLEEVDLLGAELSKVIHCPVHFPAYNKNLFECMCGVVFPLYLVKTRNWDGITKKHEEERKLVKA